MRRWNEDSQSATNELMLFFEGIIYITMTFKFRDQGLSRDGKHHLDHMQMTKPAR